MKLAHCVLVQPKEGAMEKFFYIIGTTLLFAWLLLSGSAHADSSTAACKQGCGNAHAPGAGTGKSACFVTFVAPTGATALKAQVFDVSGQGLLRNAQKQVAIRGGEPDTSRV